MKRLVIVLIVGLLVLVGCSSKAADYEVSPATAIEMIENKESFILYFGSNECSACLQFNPIFKEVLAEYPDTMVKVETLNASANHAEDFEKLQKDYTGMLEVTPTIYAFKDGVLVDKVTGLQTYSQLERMLDRNAIINK